MLKGKGPLRTFCLGQIISPDNGFCERIQGNYRFFPARISPEELLHMTMASPELSAVWESGPVNILSRNRFHRQTEMVIQLFNRLQLCGTRFFTYQDSVFVTGLLRQAGVRDTGLFYRYLLTYQREREETAILAALYDRQRAETGRMLHELKGELRAAREKERGADRGPGEGERYDLHDRIYHRLGSVEAIQILARYALRAGSINPRQAVGERAGLARFLRCADALCLERRRRRLCGAGSRMRYADTAYPVWFAGDSMREAEKRVRENLAAGVLLQLAQDSMRMPGGTDRICWQEDSGMFSHSAEILRERFRPGGDSTGWKPDKARGTDGLDHTLVWERELLLYAFRQSGETKSAAQWEMTKKETLLALLELHDARRAEMQSAYPSADETFGRPDLQQSLRQIRETVADLMRKSRAAKDTGRERLLPPGQTFPEEPGGGVWNNERAEKDNDFRMSGAESFVRTEIPHMVTEGLERSEIPHMVTEGLERSEIPHMTAEGLERSEMPHMTAESFVRTEIPHMTAEGFEGSDGIFVRVENSVSSGETAKKALPLLHAGESQETDNGRAGGEGAGEMAAWRQFLDQVNERNVQIKKQLEDAGKQAVPPAPVRVPDLRETRRQALYFLQHPREAMEALDTGDVITEAARPAAFAGAAVPESGEAAEDILYRAAGPGHKADGSCESALQEEEQQNMQLLLHTTLEEAGRMQAGEAFYRAPGTGDPMAPQGSEVDAPVLVHRRRESVSAEKLTERLEQQIQMRNSMLSQTLASLREERKKEAGSRRESTTEYVIDTVRSRTEREQAERVSENKMTVHISRIADEVYRRLEKRLLSEQRRRGY